MRREIVFVHIPKTAGTSLRNALERAADDHTILRDYGKAPETSPALYNLVHVQKKPLQLREVFDSQRRGVLLSGHFPAHRYSEVFRPKSFITFIRDPIDRVISEHNHFVSYQSWTQPLEEFATTQRFRNVISKFLARVNLKRFGFIGIMENFETDIPALGRFLGTELSVRRDNTGSYPHQPASSVAPEVRAQIAALNLDDIDLYERLKRERDPSGLISRRA
ncbi:MAG TPA: sulfotransferase family 2 domain-containing protein [Rhizomicrobium sp.]|jgi:hypothetical protein|nr:sulfotransferase family 2 domain-containing protein [Rhizomicrobium sp.]